MKIYTDMKGNYIKIRESSLRDLKPYLNKNYDIVLNNNEIKLIFGDLLK